MNRMILGSVALLGLERERHRIGKPGRLSVIFEVAEGDETGRNTALLLPRLVETILGLGENALGR